MGKEPVENYYELFGVEDDVDRGASFDASIPNLLAVSVEVGATDEN